MNKKILSALFLLFSIGGSFMSCNQNAPDEQNVKNHDKTKPEYTVMFYTVGGGDLDYSIEDDLMRAMDALYPNDVSVRFFVQMKYSNEETYWKKRKEKNPDADMSKYKLQGGKFSTVFRYELLPSMLSADKKNMLQLPESAQYGDQGDQAAFYNPDSITSFINYCKAANPNADKYILILADHGGGYSPLNDFDKSVENAGSQNGPRRAICFDPAKNGNSITMLELKEGIQKSNVKKFDLIFFDCCLLNIVDVICEMTDVATYTLASGHSTSGCDYGALVRELYLTVGGHYSQVEAFQRYTQNCADVHYDRYKNGSTDVRDLYIDWALTRTDQLPAMMRAMKTFTDAVCNYYDKDKKTLSDAELLAKYQKAANYPWKYIDIYPYYDLAGYAYALAYAMNDQEVTQAYNNLCKTIGNAIIYHSYANKAKDNNLSYSINIGAQGYLRIDFKKEHTSFACVDKDGNIGFYHPETGAITANPGNEYASPKFAWKNSFGQTAFEKATGWTRWMEKNPAMPNNNPPDDNYWDTNGL
ncbi:MAG: hypothetical protein J5902_02830 [Paludibacteraceae bacterium]|nr:hypothetical protein [Paludibacteraceae bacterium]